MLSMMDRLTDRRDPHAVGLGRVERPKSLSPQRSSPTPTSSRSEPHVVVFASGGPDHHRLGRYRSSIASDAFRRRFRMTF